MNWKKVISIVLIGVLGLMCMAACRATAGTSEESQVPDTSTTAQENADNEVTEDESSGSMIVVYYSWSENTKSIATAGRIPFDRKPKNHSDKIHRGTAGLDGL